MIIDPEKLTTIDYDKSVIISTIKGKSKIDRDEYGLNFHTPKEINLSSGGGTSIRPGIIHHQFRPILKIFCPIGIFPIIYHTHEIVETHDTIICVDETDHDKYLILKNFIVDVNFNKDYVNNRLMITHLFSIKFDRIISPLNTNQNPIIDNIYIFDNRDIHEDFENMLPLKLKLIEDENIK